MGGDAREPYGKAERNTRNLDAFVSQRPRHAAAVVTGCSHCSHLAMILFNHVAALPQAPLKARATLVEAPWRSVVVATGSSPLPRRQMETCRGRETGT